jgi:hypothetical protein
MKLPRETTRSTTMKPIAILAAILLSTLALPLSAAPVEQAVLTEGAPYTGNYGSALALSGDTLVVGRGGEEKAHVYVRSGNTWAQQAVLTASNSDPGDRFGDSVAISGDLIIVGALLERSNARGVNGDGTNNSQVEAGAAYIFKRSGTTWTQVAYLKPHVNYPYPRFGCSVAISGTTVVVGTGYGKRFWADIGLTSAGDGSPATGVDGDATLGGLTSAGAAYVYSLHGVEWRFDAYLKASNTGSFDQFGWAVAIDGDRIVVGANGEASAATGVNGDQADNSLPVAGAAYVFGRGANGKWAQEAYLKCFTPQTPGINNWGIGFGGAVALQGDTVAIGISGAGDVAAPGDRVWIFTRSPAGVWSPQQALTPLVSGSWLGHSLALSGDTLVAGQIFQGPVPAVGNGEAHVFTRNAGVWTRQAVIIPSNVRTNAGAGFAVALDGGTMVVGCGQNEAESVVGDNRVWIYTGAGAPNIALEQPASTPIASGGTKALGVLPGSFTDTVFTIRNTGNQPLNLTGTPNPVALSGSGDFSVTAQPAATLSPGGSTTYTIRFAPATAGLKTATLTIPSNDPDTSSFTINLSGRGLSTANDTDGDGMNDAAEFNLAALGFDWQANQAPLVASYFANSNANGLYTTAQVQTLNVGVPLIQRSAATGTFQLQLQLQKSTNLPHFAPFPFTPGGTTITGDGKVQFEFTTPDNAAFFRLQSSN